MKYFFILLILFKTSATAQTVSFKEIKLQPAPGIYNTKDSTIVFPIVVSKNKTVSDKINKVIRSTIIEEYNPKKTVKGNLIYFVNDSRIMSMSYEVKLNKKVLSLSVLKEGYGAYPWSATTYFNFDLATGKKINIHDLLLPNKIDSFTMMVKKDKNSFLAAYEKEEMKEFEDATDSSSRDWIVDMVENDCMKSIDISKFYLTSDSLIIDDPCQFPHVIQSQQPLYELKYSLYQIRRFINPAVYKFKE